MRPMERVARALINDIDQQTGGSWPVYTGYKDGFQPIQLVDDEIDFATLARAAIREAARLAQEAGMEDVALWLEALADDMS